MLGSLALLVVSALALAGLGLRAYGLALAAPQPDTQQLASQLAVGEASMTPGTTGHEGNNQEIRGQGQNTDGENQGSGSHNAGDGRLQLQGGGDSVAPWALMGRQY